MVSQLPKTEENTCLTIKIRTKFACKDRKKLENRQNKQPLYFAEEPLYFAK